MKFPEEILSRQVRKSSKLKVMKVDFSAPLSDDLFRDPNPAAVAPK
jgi:hypothetical protein